MPKRLVEFRDFLIDATNFILLLPVYFLGAGLSRVLWVFHKKERGDVKSHWIKSGELSDSNDEWSSPM